MNLVALQCGVFFTKDHGHDQSHYIEVVQGGISSRAIDCEYLAKKKIKNIYKRDIMQLLSVATTISFFKLKQACLSF